MKTQLELLAEKFEKNFPISMQITNDALEYAIKNNMSWTRTALIEKELSKDYKTKEGEVSEFINLISSKGYYAVASSGNGSIQTKELFENAKGTYYSCYDIYIFFNKLAWEKFEGVFYEKPLEFGLKGGEVERKKRQEEKNVYKYLEIYR